MDIEISRFAEGEEKSFLERAVSELHEKILFGEGKCSISLSSWRDGSTIKIRTNCRNIYEHIKLPDEAAIIKRDEDSLLFNYKEYRFLYFHVNF